MLSSTLVSVLAPQWSSRQRRNKRGMAGLDTGVVGTATGEPGQQTQGNREDGTVLLKLRYPNRSHSLGQQTTQNQRVGERGLILGPQAHERVCGMLLNRTVTPTSPNSPPCPQLHPLRLKSQAGRQGDQLSMQSSKLATNSPLSRRNLNSNWRNDRDDRDGDTSSPDVSPTVTYDMTSDRIRAQLSFTRSNDGDRETSKSFPYSTSPAHRKTSSDGEEATRRTRPFSTSPRFIDSEGSSVTNRPQTFRAYPHLTIPSKQTLLFSSVERLSPSDRPGGTTVPVGESHMPSSPPSLYDRLDVLRSQSLPRGTTLRSTSWRKLSVLGDGGSDSSSPLSPTTANIYNNVSSLSRMSSNDNTGPSGTNGNTVDHQSAVSNRNYFYGNLNSHAVTRKHTNMGTLVRSDAQDEPDHDVGRSPRMQDALNSNDRQPRVSSNINSPTRGNTVGSPINTSCPERHTRLSSSYRAYASLTVFSPNSPKTPDGLKTGNSPSSLSNTTSSNQHLKSTEMSPTPSVGKTRTPVVVQWERSSASPKSPEINNPTSFGSSHDSSSGQLSVQTRGAPISLSSHRPLNSSHPVDITRDPHNTPKYPPQIVKNEDPIVSSTHAPTSLLQSPKTDYSPTSITAVQSLTRDLTPTSCTRPPPPGERTLTGSLVMSSAEGRFRAQRSGRDSVESGLSGEMGSRLSPSHSLQSPMDLTSPLSPTRSRRSVEGPAIFSSLRSGSSTSPLSPPTPRTTRLHVWRGDSMHNLSRVSDTVGGGEGQVLSHGIREDSRFTFDHAGTDLAALGPQRKTAAPFSLPDIGRYYQPRFSSPPYASLKASHPHITSTQGPLSPPTSPQHYPCYNQHRTRSQDGSNVFALETCSGKNHSEPISEDNVEVLVYRISKVDSSAILDSIRPAQHCSPGHTQDTQVVSEIKCNVLPSAPSGPSQSSQPCQVIGRPSCPSYHSSNGGGAVAAETDMCKTESFAKSSVQTQSPKKGFFSLRNKRDSVVDAAAANLPRTSPTPPSEEPKPEGQKGSNKMDQMLCRLLQTFRVKRHDDNRRKRTTLALCDSEPGDVSYITEGSNSGKQPDEESKEGWRKDERVLTPPNSVWISSKHISDTTKDKVHHQHSQLKGFKDNVKAKIRDQPPAVDLPQIESHKDQNITEPCIQLSPSEISPTRRQFEAYKEERIRRARNHSPQSGVSPTRCQNWDPGRFATLPGYRPSSASPRRSSVFHFSQEDSENDSVFLSPRLLQRKKSTSLCEPRDRSSGSCADLKYGLKAGRSFSVSYVMSNRCSGPERISTGPRVVSFSDLTDPARSFKGQDMTGDDLWLKGNRKISTSNLTTDCKTTGDSPRTGSKSRNFSWCSEVVGLSPTTSCARMLNPSSPGTSHFIWDTEGPPTPPPSPPWSSAFRHTYRSLSASSTSLSPSDRRASPDSLSPRGLLPSRGYISSLAAFKELEAGSDRDSDSTTDDEYYLSGDGGEKETELCSGLGLFSHSISEQEGWSWIDPLFDLIARVDPK